MNFTPVSLSYEISLANGRIQLCPFGRFFASDGRAEGESGWYVDDTNGEMLAESINSSKVRLMVDYEHQTLHIAQNGKGNPAAGWVVRAEYLSGQGLFADVEWTDKARQQIKAKEYRYISPLFLADSTGKVVKIINAALTNRPACLDLDEAVAFSQSFFTSEEKPMLKLLQQLFGAENATEAEIKQKLTALSASKGDSTVALSDVYAELNKEKAQVVALSAQVNQPDPSKYVPLSEMKKVQDQLTALSTQVTNDKVEALVQTALSDGRLLPTQKEWALGLGKKDLVALSDYLSTATPNPALNATPQAKDEPTNKVVALSAEEVAAARMLGMSEAEFRDIHHTKEKA